MRLQISVIEKLINTFESYGGHRNQSRLKAVLSELDFCEYERQTDGHGEKILVLTEELEKEKTAANTPRR